MAQILPLELLTNTVLNLRQKIDPTKEMVGTGTFITHANQLYIVTAEHVARGMKTDCSIVVRGASDKPITLTISDLTQQSANVPWKFHPEADLAVLKLNPKPEVLSSVLVNRFLPSDNINQTKAIVDRNTQLTVIGFPLGLGALGHFSPLTFRTYASSGLITLSRADTKKPCTFIVLENPSTGGYSGGPVVDLSIYQNMGMTMTGSGTMIHGIVHGTISDETGGKLAAITPSYYIFDII